MTTPEARVQRLEDIEAIRTLKVRYAQLCDAQYEPDGIAALFTEDGEIDLGIFGVHRGRRAIREFFAGASTRITFALHMVVGHTIDIDPSGLEAVGRWYLWQPMTLDGRAYFSAVTYDDLYRKIGRRWFFRRVHAHRHFTTPYDQGWVRQRLPA